MADDEATASVPRSAHIISPASISVDPGEPLGVGLTGTVRAAAPVTTSGPTGLFRQGSSRWLDVDSASDQTNSLAGLRIAVKTYHADATSFSWGVVAAFKHEVAALTTLKHPNLVPVLGCIVKEMRGAKAPTYALVMERMESSLHSHYIAAGSPSAPSAVKLRALADVAQGLAFIHADGAVHCGLSSSHVLLDLRGTAKLTGMGLLGIGAAARATAAGHAASLIADAGATASWRYLAPELLPDPSAAEVVPAPLPPVPTRHCDIYAFAIVAWEVAAQARAYEAHGNASPEDVRTGLRPPLDALPPDLPPQFGQMLEAAWAPNPAARPSIYKILRVLNRLKEQVIAEATTVRLVVPVVASSPGSPAEAAAAASGDAATPLNATDAALDAVAALAAAAAETATATPPSAEASGSMLDEQQPPSLQQPAPAEQDPAPVPASPVNVIAEDSVAIPSARSSAAPAAAEVVPDARPVTPPTSHVPTLSRFSQDSLPPPPPPQADDAATTQAVDTTTAPAAAVPTCTDDGLERLASAPIVALAEDAGGDVAGGDDPALVRTLSGGTLTAAAALPGSELPAPETIPPLVSHDAATTMDLSLPSYDSDSDGADETSAPSLRLVDAQGLELPRQQLRAPNLTLPSGVGDPEAQAEESARAATLTPLRDDPPDGAEALADDAPLVRHPRAAASAPPGLDPSLAAQVNAFGVVSLCNLLRSYEEHRGVVIGVGKRLHRLLASASECSSCVGARGASAILAALSTHRLDDEAVEAMCRALQLLAVPPEGKAAVVRARGIEALVGTLRRLVAHPTIAQTCARAISHLLYESTPNATAAGAAGAADLFVIALETHPRHAGVVRSVARALAHLAQLHAPSRTRAVHAGAVQLIVAALTFHSANEHVVASLCGLLSQLTEGVSLCPAVLLRCGGVGPLAAAVSLNADEADVAVPALTLLARLADGNVATQAVAEGGAAKAALRVLAALPSDEAAVVAACSCLGRLASLGDAAIAADDAGIPALVAALARWPADATVAFGVCASLRRVLGLPYVTATSTASLAASEPLQGSGLASSASHASALAIVCAGGVDALAACIEANAAAPSRVLDACTLLLALFSVGGEGIIGAAAVAGPRVAAGVAAAIARRPAAGLVWVACMLLLRLVSPDVCPVAAVRDAIAAAARPAVPALLRLEAAGGPGVAPPVPLALLVDALALLVPPADHSSSPATPCAEAAAVTTAVPSPSPRPELIGPLTPGAQSPARGQFVDGQAAASAPQEAAGGALPATTSGTPLSAAADPLSSDADAATGTPKRSPKKSPKKKKERAAEARDDSDSRREAELLPRPAPAKLAPQCCAVQ